MSDQKPNLQYKIRILFWNRLFLALQAALNGLLNFFSLKTSKRFWGIVYDSVSKQPLDPVIVKLLYAHGGEAETCVTDLAGRYGFLARPGKFKIFVRRTNYRFPSLYAAGDSDGIYENLYHGEFFSLKDDTEVVAPNVPMDPQHFDWNQQAKQQSPISRPYLRLLVKRIIAAVFWFGFIIFLLQAVSFYPSLPAWLGVILLVYFVLLVLAKTVPDTRLWGEIRMQTKIPNSFGLFLELRNAQFPEVSFGHAEVAENGRFLLRTGKGKYLLAVFFLNAQKQKILIGRVPVRTGGSGVLNRAIAIS